LILLQPTPSREVSDAGGGQAGVISNSNNNVNIRPFGPAAAAAIISKQQPVNRGDVASAIAMPSNNRY
jgi:hypothetical protein